MGATGAQPAGKLWELELNLFRVIIPQRGQDTRMFMDRPPSSHCLVLLWELERHPFRLSLQTSALEARTKGPGQGTQSLGRMMEFPFPSPRPSASDDWYGHKPVGKKQFQLLVYVLQSPRLGFLLILCKCSSGFLTRHALLALGEVQARASHTLPPRAQSVPAGRSWAAAAPAPHTLLLD